MVVDLAFPAVLVNLDDLIASLKEFMGRLGQYLNPYKVL